MNLIPIFQSRDLLVIDKPPGLSIHNAGPGEADLISLACREFQLDQVFPVHRLDKETSGLQVLALNNLSARNWAERFQTHEVKKIYRAIVRGNISEASGVWNKPLTDKAEGRMNPQGLSSQRVPCETRFKTLIQNRFFSLLELDLHTGRQHQIRKHSALIRHAIVGDSRYGEKSYNSKIAKLYGTQRMFLHCHRISFENFVWESSMPDEFEKLMTPIAVPTKE